MDLQQIFYLIGIIFMVTYLLLLVAIVVLLFYIRKKVGEMQVSLEEKFEIAKAIIAHPKEMVASMAQSAINKIGDIGKEKRSHREED